MASLSPTHWATYRLPKCRSAVVPRSSRSICRWRHGAGLATLAGGLQAHRPELLDGSAHRGIDRFMSEIAR